MAIDHDLSFAEFIGHSENVVQSIALDAERWSDPDQPNMLDAA
jgi:hypothetical protein